MSIYKCIYIYLHPITLTRLKLNFPIHILSSYLNHFVDISSLFCHIINMLSTYTYTTLGSKPPCTPLIWHFLQIVLGGKFCQFTLSSFTLSHRHLLPPPPAVILFFLLSPTTTVIRHRRHCSHQLPRLHCSLISYVESCTVVSIYHYKILIPLNVHF